MQETEETWVKSLGQEDPLTLGRSPGVRDGNPLQYSCLKSSKDRGAWWAVATAGPRNELTSAYDSEQVNHTTHLLPASPWPIPLTSGSASLPILLDCLPLALSSPRSPCCVCTSHSPFPSSDGKSLALGSQDRLAAKDDPRGVAKAMRRAGQTAPTVREEGDLGGSQAWSPPSHPQPDSCLGALIQGEP